MSQGNIDLPRLEARRILSFVCSKSEDEVALLDRELSAEETQKLEEIIRQRLEHKPLDKILLISDSLPITKSNLKEMMFAGEKVFYDGVKATSAEGTLAGSTTLIPDIIKRLYKSGLLFCVEDFVQLIENPYHYHNIDLSGELEWDDDWNIINVLRF